ncbi:MAG: dihydropteroate synthase [Phycisphaerales bacterium]
MPPPPPIPPPTPAWRLANGRSISLDRPRLLAILNVTPDSFSDGGRFIDPDAAVERAHHMAQQGADMLDIGAESTRPGAASVPPDEQRRRLEPVLRRLRAANGPASNLPISIDTTSAEVARAALDLGADAVNDQSAGRDDPEMLELIARHDRVAGGGAGVILMHRARAPAQDRYSTDYERLPDYGPDGVVSVVRRFLEARAAAAARHAGIAADSIVLDPGLGFGKSVEQNWELCRALPQLHELGYPALCAVSRKSFIAAAMAGPDHLGPLPPPDQRVAASVGTALGLALRGVRLFRIHDVKEHREALDIAARLPPPT